MLSKDDIEGAQSLYGSNQAYEVLQGANVTQSPSPSSGIPIMATSIWKRHLFLLVAIWLVG